MIRSLIIAGACFGSAWYIWKAMKEQRKIDKCINALEKELGEVLFIEDYQKTIH